jgi:pyruvate formate lyase activating enzyme
MIIAGFQGTTLIDFPGKVASIIFLGGCNLRCPYCHNGTILDVNSLQDEISFEEIKLQLQKRKKLIDGVVITGGEPTIWNLSELIDFIKSIGLSVKLDTNGLNPDKLKEYINKVDYVAVDLKGVPSVYESLLKSGAMEKEVEKKLLETKAVIEKAGVSVEYRTTLYPGAVPNLESLKIMQKFIPENATWYLQSFVPGNCYSDDANEMLPFKKDVVVDWKKDLDIIFENIQLRGFSDKS